MPYWCTKFEANQSTSRLFFGSKLNSYIGAKKKKNMKKIGQFSKKHISKTNKSISLGKLVYMEGIKYVNLIEISSVYSYRDTRC